MDGIRLTFETIKNCFDFVGSAPLGECQAVVHRKTGESYFAAVLTDYDELPDDVDENDDYVMIPHKNDLDLGKQLVMDFVRSRCPELTDRVEAIFSRRGAYGWHKSLLSENNLLEEWHEFEDKRTEEALLEWCASEELAFVEND